MIGEAQPGRSRLVVVSADAELLAAAQEELVGHGYDIVAVPDAAAVVAEVRAQPPAAVLVDADDPAAAMEILDALRLHHTGAGDADGGDAGGAVPVVLVASRLTTDGVNEGLSRGAYDHLRKPVDRAELVSRVVAAARTGVLRRDLRARQQEADDLLRVDPLTGLASRRSVEEHLEMLASSARRLRTPLSVLVVDVDRIARVNRDYGRPAGDAVVRSVAQTISSCLRGEDVAGRRGGDQFLIVLPHTSLDGGWRLGDRIRQAVTDRPVVLDDDRDIVVTVSVGCSEGYGDDPGGQVRRAQVALWEAKSSGRNKAVADTTPIAS